MKAKHTFGLLALWLNPLHTHAAVNISENQTGQALVVPFYTVANNLNTLVSISNTQNQAKAMKVHIKDGHQGAVISTFNLYLDANDTWAFAMLDDANGPVLFSNDQSCQVNAGMAQPGIPTPPPSWDRQTGTIEIIEMGNINSDGGVFGEDKLANQCAAVADAWENEGSGIWSQDPNAEMTGASGGIQVQSTVIDVINGFAFDAPSFTFENFYPANSIVHTPPESHLPDLSSGTNQSVLIHDGQVIQTTWPTGYEAISALLMKSTVENEYDVDPVAAGNTEWILTFPTAQFHKANSTTQKPFIFDDPIIPDDLDDFRFPADFSNAYRYYNRESDNFATAYACGLLPPGVPCPPESSLDHFVNTFLVNPFLTDFTDSAISGESSGNIRVLNLAGSTALSEEYISGKVKLNIISELADEGSDPIYALINDRGNNSVTEARQYFHGLPVVGFAVQMYRNGNAQPGLLATYASAKVHSGERIITEE